MLQVTGIVGRADVLACIFFLLSFLAYHGWVYSLITWAFWSYWNCSQQLIFKINEHKYGHKRFILNFYLYISLS